MFAGIVSNEHSNSSKKPFTALWMLLLRQACDLQNIFFCSTMNWQSKQKKREGEEERERGTMRAIDLISLMTMIFSIYGAALWLPIASYESSVFRLLSLCNLMRSPFAMVINLALDWSTKRNFILHFERPKKVHRMWQFISIFTEIGLDMCQ